MVKTAKDRGFKTRVVTSAYWGKSEKNASKKMQELKEGGLDELSISWDDYHEEFVEFSSIANAFWAAKKQNLTVAINMVQQKNSKWDRKLVLQKLNLPEDTEEIIVESCLNLTGRADEELSESEFKTFRHLGPCPYVITGPTLSAKNKLLACCGVIPETEHLIVDKNFSAKNLSISIKKMQESTILRWLYLRGPYNIMEWISKEYGISIPAKDKIGGNCEACKMLFTSKTLEYIDQAIECRKIEINSEVDLLTSLGMIEPKHIQSIWAESSFLGDQVE